ncbi:MAG: precorrin-3B C(17)-methyltransferase [Lachnospiraceae bacterium]|nr:precorrin-3B C(17)-methyltransferase [Lachnospiraceae bacterium]
MAKIYVVGIGPGEEKYLTGQAADALERSSVIAGYKTYIELVRDRYPDKEFFSNGMKQERERCRQCVAYALEGKTVSLICSGDAGVYGMASLMLETAEEMRQETGGLPDAEDIEIVPGVTAALSGAALLGAPIGHDFCVISLSDLLTPLELIEKRLKAAAEADLCIVLYNPGSRNRAGYLKHACGILMEKTGAERVCGYVRNIGRQGTEQRICTLKELAETEADMFTTVFIGNSRTRECGGRMVTPRGYDKDGNS